MSLCCWRISLTRLAIYPRERKLVRVRRYSGARCGGRDHGPGHFSWGSGEPEAEERTDEELRPANAAEVEEEEEEDVSEAGHSEEGVEETVRDDVGDEMWVADRTVRPVRARRPPVHLQDFILCSP